MELELNVKQKVTYWVILLDFKNIIYFHINTYTFCTNRAKSLEKRSKFDDN